MEPLRASLPGLVRAFRKSRRRLILIDFDGTLAPIRRDPREAWLPPAANAVLRRLAARPDVSVWVVTGRSLADIRRRCPVPGIHYVASHGYQVRLADGSSHRWHDSEADARIRSFERRLRRSLRSHRGLYFENKGPTLALHYRQASRTAAAEAREAAQVLSGGDPSVSLASGKKVIEICAAPLRTKGMAVLEIVRWLQRPSWIAYFGDDVTDETVFRLMPARAVTVYVGRPKRSFSARYYVRSPAAVVATLARLDRALD